MLLTINLHFIDKVCALLSDLDKLFSKVDLEFEKCIKFLKEYQYFYNDSLEKLHINDITANTVQINKMILFLIIIKLLFFMVRHISLMIEFIYGTKISF